MINRYILYCKINLRTYAAFSTSGPVAPTLVPSFALNVSGAPMYLLNSSSTFSSMSFVNLTNMSLVLIGSRVVPMAIVTVGTGTPPMTLVSTGAAAVAVTSNDNRRNLFANVQYAIAPRYGNTSATGGNVSSTTVTLYFLLAFKREFEHFKSLSSIEQILIVVHLWRTVQVLYTVRVEEYCTFVVQLLYNTSTILLDAWFCRVDCCSECADSVGSRGCQRTACPRHLVQRISRVVPKRVERRAVCGSVGAHECVGEHVDQRIARISRNKHPPRGVAARLATERLAGCALRSGLHAGSGCRHTHELHDHFGLLLALFLCVQN